MTDTPFADDLARELAAPASYAEVRELLDDSLVNVPPYEPVAPVEPEAAPAPEVTPAAVPPGCNVPGCDDAPEWRGLCPAHRASRRGDASPKESK